MTPPSSEQLQGLLQEYQEVAKHVQHHDSMMAQLAAFFLGITTLLMSSAIAFFAQLPLAALAALAVMSTFMAFVTLVVVMRVIKFKNIGFRRAQEIEEQLGLGMKYFGLIQNERPRSKETLGSRFTTSSTGKITFVAIVLMWISLVALKLAGY